MVARHFYRYVPGDPVEEVPNVLRWGYTANEKAEEGEAGSWEVFVDDPDMTADFVGHRRWLVYEDESDDANELLIDGIVTAVRVAHKGGDITGPMGRVWTLEITDLNTLFTYRVMTGSDSQFADDQTDVDRVLQVANSEEMGYFDDLTLVDAGDTEDLDELNGRGMTTGQILDACAQETGKNWYIFSEGTIAGGADIKLWYGLDSLDTRTSPLNLSNAPEDLDMAAVDDGSALTYPIGADTELRRDYARQYDGAYGEFQDGAKYIPEDENPYSPGLTLSGRDIVHPAPEIKTRARMKRRLLRVLRDHATPDEVFKTTIVLPANRVTQVRAGMRIAFRATHEPNYEDFRYLRILSASPSPTGRKYKVALELQGPGTAEPGETVSMVATNDKIGTETYTAEDDSPDVEFVAGQVWRWTLTNTIHDPECWTQALRIYWIKDGSTLNAFRQWEWAGGPDFPTTRPDQPFDSGTHWAPLADDTGTFTVDETGTGHFTIQVAPNYLPFPVDVNEQWTVVMELLS